MCTESSYAVVRLPFAIEGRTSTAAKTRQKNLLIQTHRRTTHLARSVVFFITKLAQNQTNEIQVGSSLKYIAVSS